MQNGCDTDGTNGASGNTGFVPPHLIISDPLTPPSSGTSSYPGDELAPRRVARKQRRRREWIFIAVAVGLLIFLAWE